ncbi:LamG-like jellyroll fold domain-containing protein [Thermopirellula anaerolimosa]
MRLTWVLAALAAAIPVGGTGWCENGASPGGISGDGGKPAVHGESPLYHWTFDDAEATVCLDSGKGGWHAEHSGQDNAGVRLGDGLFATCLQLQGEHKIATVGPMPRRPTEQIGFSVWVMPTELRGYREIFRKEDGDRRLLFSFQNDGTILSLGLNIGGYVECDAPIRPEDVMDGRWHHCAATFDGRVMRVYLDGRMIGELERPGTISCGGDAPGCIGSLNGGENFQGRLDDLRIYDRAPDAEEIAALHRTGLQIILARQDQAARWVQRVYHREGTFLQTLSGLQGRLKDVSQPVTADAHALLVRCLQADFPQEIEALSRFAELPPEFCVLPSGEHTWRKAADRVHALLIEYRPLTDEQWRRASDADREYWRQIDEVARGYRDLVETKTPDDSPAWLEFILKAGPEIRRRPRLQEAVAPYVLPETPPTRSLTEAEARTVLERDWLCQVGGNPAADRIRRELERTRRLAERTVATLPASGAEDKLSRIEACRREMDALIAEIPEAGERPDLYFRLRRLKRELMFLDPTLDFDRLVFIDQPFPQGSEWRHETRHRLGYMAVPGGRLLVLEGLGPDGTLRQLAPQAPLHGSFWRPDVDFDGRNVLFCFKPHNEKSFHIYEVAAEGGPYRRLTAGPYDDLDPIYLPDGKHILFSTTRGNTYVRCMPPTNAFILARCDRDGRNIYLISANNEPDYLPSLMPDGRVLYTRWEYTDKPLWRAQSLWTVRPDGTQTQVFWGNQSVWPDLLKDARVIPGSRRVMFTGSAHHDWFSGAVGIIDPDRGFNFPHGLTKVTRELPWPECGNGPVDPGESDDYESYGRYQAYYSPYPLSERLFLVSALREGKFVLYLMDVDGNRELIYEGTHNIWYAMPLRPRKRPQVLTESVVWPTRATKDHPADGIIYTGNVYQNAPPELRGRAKFLRVWTIDHKTYTYWHQRPYISTGPVVSALQSDGVKRLLGTVPLESDGSAAFYAPSGIPLHFQLLDERQRALQTMRSFANVMPGETRGCLGCHESHSRAPMPDASGLALRATPRTITPPPWEDRTVSYPRYVQPVLDRYCGSCHQGEGEATAVLDLTPRPGFLGFAEPYFLLIGRPTWGQPYRKPEVIPAGFGIANPLIVEGYATTDPQAYRTPPPMTALSYNSALVELCASGKHYGVKVDDVSLLRIIAWVDAMTPYRGEEEIREIPDPEFQGVDWLAIRPRIKTAVKVIRPGPVDDAADDDG